MKAIIIRYPGENLIHAAFVRNDLTQDECTKIREATEKAGFVAWITSVTPTGDVQGILDEIASMSDDEYQEDEDK